MAAAAPSGWPQRVAAEYRVWRGERAIDKLKRCGESRVRPIAGKATPLVSSWMNGRSGGKRERGKAA